jgi:hypothetical protein
MTNNIENMLTTHLYGVFSPRKYIGATFVHLLLFMSTMQESQESTHFFHKYPNSLKFAKYVVFD